MFPSPLEVDRYLYTLVHKQIILSIRFPSPLEVDNLSYEDLETKNELFPAPLEVVGIYTSITGNYDIYDILGFPAPLEVDRFLYTIILLNKLKTFCFRPLSR